MRLQQTYKRLSTPVPLKVESVQITVLESDLNKDDQDKQASV